MLNMKRFLLIDDIRNWTDSHINLDCELDLITKYNHETNQIEYSCEGYELVIARTFDEGLEKIKQGGWERIYLDHDLGEFGRKTGYELICFIEENPDLAPNWFSCVSANLVGRQKILDCWKSIQKNNPNQT